MESGLTEDGLENCEIIKTLGVGSFGIVVQVKRQSLFYGSEAAVKLIPMEMLIKQRGSLEEVVRWTRIWSTLRQGKLYDNPHILRCFEMRRTHETLFVFLELMAGGALFDRIQEAEYLLENDVRDVAKSLCSALVDVHAAGLAHRDVKPENIMLKHRDSPLKDVVLCDFGIAEKVDSADELMTGFAGSPGYSSPEMSAGRPYTVATDLFSLGVLLFESLTGRSPFRGHTPLELIKEAATVTVSFPRRYFKHISPVAIDFVRRLVERDPLLRMSASEALQHPWLTDHVNVGERLSAANLAALDDASLPLPSPRHTQRSFSYIGECPVYVSSSSSAVSSISVDKILSGDLCEIDAIRLAELSK